MKKAIIFLLVMLPMMVMSQTVVSGFYKAFAGTTADTLTTGVTKTWVLDLGNAGAWGGKAYDITFQVLNARSVDSIYYALKFYPSVDGVTFTRKCADSTAVVKGIVNHTYQTTLTAQTARYWKVAEIAVAHTQTSRVYGYVSVKTH